MTEHDFKKVVGITDFRHLTKDKVLQFASNLDKLDPEVAKEIIEQFPEFSSTMLNITKEYRETISDLIKQNAESSKSTCDAYNRILDSLEKTLSNGNLKFEERKWIIEQMKEISDRLDAKDSENKNFLLKMAGIAGTVVIATGAFLISVLGGKTTYCDNQIGNDKNQDPSKNEG